MRLSGKILGNFFVKYSLNTPANGQSEQKSITDLCLVYLRNLFRGVGGAFRREYNKTNPPEKFSNISHKK